MRLICPNCGAQYEVDASVIPDTGRDVQCSNCGHTWFQRPAELDPDLAEEMGFEIAGDESSQPEGAERSHEEAQVPDFGEPEAEDALDGLQSDMPDRDFVDDLEDGAAEDENESIKGAVADMAARAAEAMKTGVEEPAHDQEAVETGAPEIKPDEGRADESSSRPREVRPRPRPAVSESVRDILRAEVEFDQTVRQPAPEALESQPELGIESASDALQKQGLRERMARLRGLDPSDASTGLSAAAISGKRRDLLPDIEEINSTLSAASERDADGTVPDEDALRERARKSGFRSTFFGLITISVLLLALYVFAPLIAEKVPALESFLDMYVANANTFRVWLDETIMSASERLNELVGQLSQNGA